MQLQRELSALNLALFWLNCGFSAEPAVQQPDMPYRARPVP